MRTRTHEIKVRLDDQELAHLDAMVAKTVQSREGFIRQILAGYQLVEAPSEDFRELTNQVTRLGNNINTMLFKLNTKGYTSLEQLQQAADELWETRDAVRNLLNPYLAQRTIIVKEADDG